MDIVQRFGDNIFRDLQAAAGGGVHSALQVDAIRYLDTFRHQVRFASSTRVGHPSHCLPRQLRKEQLVSVLPLLLNRLGSQVKVVVYTYAAVALDRILYMRTGGSITPMYAFVLVINFCRFSSVDVQSFAPQHLNIILAKIGVQNSPERTAEIDFLMRCVCASSCHCVLVPDEYLSQVLRELSSRRNERLSGSTLPCFRGSSISSAKSLQTRATRTLINTSSKAYQVLFGSSALLCRTRSPFSSLRC